MAGVPIAPGPKSAGSQSESGIGPNYSSALSALTLLFFMMGFITCLNDILIPYLKTIFQLNYTQANLINLCFFGTYFIMGIPTGKIVHAIGYKKGILLGFVIAAIGTFLFYPAAEMRIYGLFLGALFILATGIVLLQVAGNPYVAVLGRPESAPARLTLTQAFNSLGTFIAPQVGTYFILKNLPKQAENLDPALIDVSHVQIPYLIIGGVLLLIALALSFTNLPSIRHEGEDGAGRSSALHYRHLVLGMVGIFTYVGAEVAIGSHIVNYLNLPDVKGMNLEEAGYMVKYYWGGAMVGRFLGAYLLSKFKPGNLLAFNAIGAAVLVLISMVTSGDVAMYSLLAVGLMNSLMFATIFTLAVAGLGRHTQDASGYLNVAIFGGAIIPFFYGMIADASSLRIALLLPVVCYLYIMYYGLKGYKADEHAPIS